MKTIIAGSRSITDYSIVCRAIEAVPWEITEVVSGTARGVDRLGERWAKENNILLKKFPASWDIYGKIAGLVRNQKMADYANALLAVWDGKSSGTCDMIKRAEKHGLKVLIVDISKWEAV